MAQAGPAGALSTALLSAPSGSLGGSQASKFSNTFCCTSNKGEVYIMLQSCTSWGVLLQVSLSHEVLLQFYFNTTVIFTLYYFGCIIDLAHDHK